jgi:hypothetical protein
MHEAPSRPQHPRRQVPIAAAIACILAVGLALADPAPCWGADRAANKKARDHYRRGEAAFKAQDFDRAFREFEAGYVLSEKPLFLLNMAHTERRRGQLRNAQSLYNTFLTMEPRSPLKGEVETVLREIEGVLALEDASRSKFSPPPVGSPSPTGLEPPPPQAPPPAAEVARRRPVLEPRVQAEEPPRMVIARREGSSDREDGDAPVYTRWWFWGGAAGVVAGAVLTGMLLSRDSYVRDGSIGTLRSP